MRSLLKEALLSAYWWIRMELRRGQSFATVALFSALLVLVVGISYRRIGLSEEELRLLFWIVYAFALFYAIPRPILDRRPEEWRWLHQLFSIEGRALGLWVYTVGLTLTVGLYLMGGSVLLWGYAPTVLTVIVGGASLGVPLALTALLAAKAEASYTVAGVLGLPLLLFPLLWVSVRSQPSLLTLSGIFLVETILLFILLPSVWRD